MQYGTSEKIKLKLQINKLHDISQTSNQCVLNYETNSCWTFNSKKKIVTKIDVIGGNAILSGGLYECEISVQFHRCNDVVRVFVTGMFSKIVFNFHTSDGMYFYC